VIQIKDDEMGEACGTHEINETLKQNSYFGWKPEGKYHSEDLGIDGKIIL
jgi:hypothetical protein